MTSAANIWIMVASVTSTLPLWLVSAAFCWVVFNSVNSAIIDEEATEMFDRLVKQLAKREGVTEQLKANNQMLWVARMNNIRNRATEIVNTELIYTRYFALPYRRPHQFKHSLFKRAYSALRF